MSFQRRGIKLSSLNDLILLLYTQTTKTVHNKLKQVPSCIHYKDISEMKTTFCGQCGSRNEVKGIEIEDVEYIFTLRDIVHERNNFQKVYSNVLISEIKSDIIGCLRKNNYMLYIAEYEYLLASSFSDGCPMLWLSGGEHVAIQAGGQTTGLCSRCFDLSNCKKIKGEVFILMTKHSWLSQDFFAFLNRKGLDFIAEEGLDVEYFEEAKTLEKFAKRSLESQNIKEYSHCGCFF